MATRRQWTLGKCDWKLSHSCPGSAKSGEVTCRHCRLICTDQQQEETKQAYDGKYCSSFGCWKQSVALWGPCRSCINSAGTPHTQPQAPHTQPQAPPGHQGANVPPPPTWAPHAELGAGAPQARTPQARTPARTPSPGVHVPQNWMGRTPLDLNQIVDTATTDELRDLIILASQRLHYFLQEEHFL